MLNALYMHLSLSYPKWGLEVYLLTRIRSFYLEGLFVDVDVIASFCFLGLAEEYEIFKEEDVPITFLSPRPYNKLVPT